MADIVKKITEVQAANIMRVEVGTNCPQGGDAGHGGRTHFKLVDEGSTALAVSIDDGPQQDVRSIEIILGGDSEAETFVWALEFALDILQAQLLLNRTEDA